MRQDVATHCEVFGDHSKVEVPIFVVTDRETVKRLESVCRDVVSQREPRENFCCNLLHVLLVIDNADDHVLQDEIGLARVRIGLSQSTIRQ